MHTHEGCRVRLATLQTQLTKRGRWPRKMSSGRRRWHQHCHKQTPRLHASFIRPKHVPAHTTSQRTEELHNNKHYDSKFGSDLALKGNRQMCKEPKKRYVKQPSTPAISSASCEALLLKSNGITCAYETPTCRASPQRHQRR